MYNKNGSHDQFNLNFNQKKKVINLLPFLLYKFNECFSVLCTILNHNSKEIITTSLGTLFFSKTKKVWEIIRMN